MIMFMIHMFKDDKSIPLLWGIDDETRSRLGRNAAMLYSFPNRTDADKVMAEVPALFDMDDNRAKTLHIVQYQPMPWRTINPPGFPATKG